MDLQPVKAPRQRSMVSWEQERMWKKWTYNLSRHPCRDPWSAGNNKECRKNGLTSCQRHPGRDPWSARNNKECGINGLTSCQGTQAEIHGQLGTIMNVK